MNVFVCATFADLRRERDAVNEAILRLKHQHNSMEYFGARPHRPVTTCLDEVRKSDVLVVIVGSMYGSTTPPKDLSFTETEYEEGYGLGKQCLVYLRDENVKILPVHVESEPNNIPRLKRFKALLKSRHTIATFKRPTDLALQVAADLSQLFVKRVADISDSGEISKTLEPTVQTMSARELPSSPMYRDLNNNLDMVSVGVRQHLNSENCSIFLVSEDQPEYLKLVSQSGGRPQHSPLIPIQSILKGGLTGHIAEKGELFNDHGPSLRNNPYATGKPPQHLHSKECFSLLAMPIKDRKGKLFGLVKVENKTAPGVKPGPAAHAKSARVPSLLGDDIYFTDADENIIRILANDIVLTFDTLRMTEAFRVLIGRLNRNPTLQEFFHEVLTQVRRLTGADRGDIIWWNEEKQQLSLWAAIPEGKLRVGDLMPERSVASKVIGSGQERRIPDVTVVDDYYCCDERTVSEVVVPVKYGNPPKSLGALNAEWFEDAAYDSQDVEILQYSAELVALGANIIESKDRDQAIAFRDLQLVIGNMQKQTSPEEILRQVLYALVSSNFDRARIFKYILQDDSFECLDSMGVEELGSFKGYVIRANRNKYAQFTLSEWQTNPAAAVREPQKMFGPDPNAEGLHKPAELPWAIAPLVVLGKLYGYIAADNAKNRRPILAKDLRRMDLFTTLTAQLIDNILSGPQKVGRR